MAFQVPHRQVRIARGVEDLLEDSIPVSDTLSHNTEDVGLRGVPPYHTTGLALHTHHLSHNGAHPNPVKQIQQDVEFPL